MTVQFRSTTNYILMIIKFIQHLSEAVSIKLKIITFIRRGDVAGLLCKSALVLANWTK